MFVFNFGVGSLEQSVKLGQLVIFDFFDFFQTDNQKVVLFTVFSLFERFFSCGGERNPSLNAGYCFTRKFSNFVATSKARI